MNPAPESLRRLQAAFGASIRVPFDFSPGHFECQAGRYDPEAVERIRPRGGSPPRERLAVYNQQYWYRLLSALQEDFPLLRHALTVWEFNQLATAYLDAHPSRSPYLEHLADRMEEFIRGGHRWDNPRNRQIVDLECAFIRAFHAPEPEGARLPSALSPDELEALPGRPLALHPALTWLREDWDLVANRAACWRDADDTVTVEFREHVGYWAVFRLDGQVEARPLDPLAFRLLGNLGAGLSLEEACAAAAGGLDAEGLEKLGAGIQGWFAEWTRLGWLRV